MFGLIVRDCISIIVQIAVYPGRVDRLELLSRWRHGYGTGREAAVVLAVKEEEGRRKGSRTCEAQKGGQW